MRSRDMCEPVGEWVNPACEGATDRERKEVKVTPLGREQ
jgi:hypothetical protein